MQFALTHGNSGTQIYLLEVNPRASRTTPFVAKATGLPVAQVGAQVMVGKTLEQLLPDNILADLNVPHYAIKEVVLPFRRFPDSTTLLGPEMKSTGEVMGISKDFAEAFCKAYLAGDQHLPKNIKDGVILFVLQSHKHIPLWQELAYSLYQMGFEIGLLAIPEIEEIFQDISFRSIPSVAAQRPNVLDMLIDNQVALILNQAPENEEYSSDCRKIRQIAVAHDIPYTTTLNGAQALVKAIQWYHKNNVRALALQDLLPVIELV